MSLNKGTCWDILDITYSNDKKVIKRAYHKLLRKYKPDEHPEEFQILYQAYQDALTNSDDVNFQSIEESIEIETEIIIPLEASNQTSYQKEVTSYEIFNARVDALTYDNDDIDIFNNFSNWSFIEELGFSEDLQYHRQYAQYLFDSINYIDKKFDKSILNVDIIFYFNDIFLWSKYWSNYNHNSAIFKYLDKTNFILKDFSLYIKLKKSINALTYENNNIEVFNNLNNWDFIKKLAFDESIHEHRIIERYLFKALNDVDQKFSKSLLSSTLIHYLNKIFRWDKPVKKYNDRSRIFQYLGKVKNISYLAKPTKIPLKTKLISISIDIVLTIIISFTITQSLYFDPFTTSFYFFIFYGLPFLWFDIKTPGQYIMKLKVFEEGDNEVAYTSYAASVIRVSLTTVSIYSLLLFIQNPLTINLYYLIVLLNIYLLYTKSLLLQDLWGTKVYEMDE